MAAPATAKPELTAWDRVKFVGVCFRTSTPPTVSPGIAVAAVAEQEFSFSGRTGRFPPHRCFPR